MTRPRKRRPSLTQVGAAARRVFGRNSAYSVCLGTRGFLCAAEGSGAYDPVRVVGRTLEEAYAMALAALAVREKGEWSGE